MDNCAEIINNLGVCEEIRAKLLDLLGSIEYYDDA